MMKTRKIRVMLWLSTVCLLGGTGAVVGLHLAFPALVKTAANDTGAPSGVVQTEDKLIRSPVDPVSLQRVARKDIRQQLFDPPVVAPKPPPPKPLPPIELISTILGDNKQHRAWVRDGQATRKVMVGDSLGTVDNPVIVESIEKDRLLLRHESKQVEVNQQATSGGRR